jgi:hypothetical protein
MDETQRLICASEALADSGRGVRFEVEYFGERAPAFAVRCAGAVHAYLNRCAHVAMELDWQEGYFSIRTRFAMLDSRRDVRRAQPLPGRPCSRSRWWLRVEERDGQVYFMGFTDD